MMLTKNIRHIVGILSMLVASVLLYGCAQTGVNDAPTSVNVKSTPLTTSFTITIDNRTDGMVDDVHVFHGNNYDFYAFVGWTGQYTYSFDDQITAITIHGTNIANNATTAVTEADGTVIYVTRSGNVIVIDTNEVN